MSAENAWRIAMEFAVVAGNPRPTADFEAAFRAAVEAETEELRRMLEEAASETVAARP